MSAEVDAKSNIPLQELVDLAVVWASQHGLVSPIGSLLQGATLSY